MKEDDSKAVVNVRLSNLSKSCSYSKTNKKCFSEEFLVILLVGYKDKIV